MWILGQHFVNFFIPVSVNLLQSVILMVWMPTHPLAREESPVLVILRQWYKSILRMPGQFMPRLT